MASKLLIIGDSFCNSQDRNSWTKLISNFDVRVDSDCGIGEYKIWQKVRAHKIQNFDKIIIVHTSPYRLHIKENPLHTNSLNHRRSDLIYQDIKSKPDGKFKNLVCDWFEQVVDLDNLNDVHGLIVKEIQQICKPVDTLHITFFDYEIPGVTSINDIWVKNHGTINHMDATGNRLVTKFLDNFLK